MERLTEWNREHTHGQVVKGDGYTKLARYEDTGLEPEDVERLRNMQLATVRQPVDLEELKKFHDTMYDCSDIAEKLIPLANLENEEGLREELLDALHYIMSAADNPYNKDYFRVFYNVLLRIAGSD